MGEDDLLLAAADAVRCLHKGGAGVSSDTCAAQVHKHELVPFCVCLNGASRNVLALADLRRAAAGSAIQVDLGTAVRAIWVVVCGRIEVTCVRCAGGNIDGCRSAGARASVLPTCTEEE